MRNICKKFGTHLFKFLKIVNISFCFFKHCLLYTSDAADERSSVDLGGRRIIKKKHIYYIR